MLGPELWRFIDIIDIENMEMVRLTLQLLQLVLMVHCRMPFLRIESLKKEILLLLMQQQSMLDIMLI